MSNRATDIRADGYQGDASAVWRRRRIWGPAIGAPLLAASLFVPASCGGSESEGPRPDPGPDASNDARVTARPPSVSSVTVEGATGRQIRQGYGTARIRLTGSKFDGLSEVTIGPENGEPVPVTLASTNATELLFTISVPHGAKRGEWPITITAASGATTSAGVLITEITASPAGADGGDAGVEGLGTAESPFRSMKKALSVAGTGDTVLLKNGTYDKASGDDFVTPNQGNPDTVPNVPAGVTIQGESATETKLVGPSGGFRCTQAGARVGLVLAGDARIEALAVSGFCTGIFGKTGTVNLQDVGVRGTGDAAIRMTGNASIRMDGVRTYGDDPYHGNGIDVDGSVTLTMNNSRVERHAVCGFCARTSGSVTVTGSEIIANGLGDDDYGQGMLVKGVTAPSFVTVERTKITDNFVGLSLDSGNAFPSVTIVNSHLLNNVKQALSVWGAWAVRVRRSIFRGGPSRPNIEFHSATSEATPRALDFGTLADLGENTFEFTLMGFQDYRLAGSGPVQVTGNTWVGAGLPPVGCSQASHPPDGSRPKNWEIVSPGTCPSPGNVFVNERNR